MTASLLLGREIGGRLKTTLLEEISKLTLQRTSPISLLTIQIGGATDAALYGKAIGRMCLSVGLHHIASQPQTCETNQNAISFIHDQITLHQPTGVLLLSPIPAHLSYGQIVAAIPITLDAEGTRYDAAGFQKNRAYPPTALAVLETIRATGLSLTGLNAVVVGRSRIVGKPVADLLLIENATVTICHSHTQNLQSFVENSDIVVAAAGKPGIIRGSWIKKGAVVSDAGENVLNGHPVGDVEFEIAKENAGYITPVPQGVGPLTTLMLAKNVLALAKNRST